MKVMCEEIFPFLHISLIFLGQHLATFPNNPMNMPCKLYNCKLEYYLSIKKISITCLSL